MALPISNGVAKAMLDAVLALNNEPLYMVAFHQVRKVINPPWWAFWRAPEVTWTEERYPQHISCRFETDDQNMVDIKPTEDVPWSSLSRFVVVNAGGLIIAGWPAHIECDRDGPRLDEFTP